MPTDVLLDGFVDLEGGSDTGSATGRVLKNQVGFSVNCRFRGGVAQNRPAFLNCKTTTPSLPLNVGSGVWQGASFYEADDGLSCIVAAIAGTLKRIDVIGGFTVQDITPVVNLTVALAFTIPAVGVDVNVQMNFPDELTAAETVQIDGGTYTVQNKLATYAVLRNVTGAPGVTVVAGTLVKRLVGATWTKISHTDLSQTDLNYSWFCQAENYLLISNGHNRIVYYDGATAQRCSGIQLGVARCMAYIQGRVWYATAIGTAFRAGDQVYSNGSRSDVLNETENTYLAGGGDFSVPSSGGPIRALRPIAQIDTSFGQGSLMVFCESCTYSVNTPVDRAAWASTAYPLQTIALPTSGSKGDRNTINVNGDIFYRCQDGMRSLALASRDFSTVWANSPLSRGAKSYLKNDDPALLFYGSAVVFDNRLLMTCLPVWSEYGVYHNGLVALDFDPTSGMTRTATPSWDGIWNGLKILQIVSGTFLGEERCFAFVLNASNQINLWELTKDDPLDNGAQEIVWSFDTGSLGFGNPMQRKKLITGEIWSDAIYGNVSYAVKWHPDQYQGWTTWHSWSECADIDQCNTAVPAPCITIQNLQKQYRPAMGLPAPPESCNTPVMMLMEIGYEFSFRFTVTGAARILQARFKATPEVESLGECRGAGVCQTHDVCNADPLDYTTTQP